MLFTFLFCVLVVCIHLMCPLLFSLSKFCYIYTKHVNVTVRSLYPNSQGPLRDALQGNLETLYKALGDPECPQIPMW
jgi:hypothetical protein